MGVCVLQRGPATISPAWALLSGCLGPLGWVITTYLFCTPSCNRQRRSSGRWMRPSPCSRRCCDPPPIPTHSPRVPPTGMAAINYFANICSLCVVWAGCGQGTCRGLTWEFPGAPGEPPAPARPWVLVGRGMRLSGSVSGRVPGLSHATLLPAPSSLPPRLTSLHCARASTPAFFRYILWPWISPLRAGAACPHPLAKSLPLTIPRLS